ncbi:MAG TPA: class I tRNA ligase family protein, partial [Candidatus Hydrogenedentes bacterium]|nr:class I tRNA ligase family protein [Candidatus Hydrogenedentota bacterium]
MSRPVFDPVPPDFSFAGSERDISRFWKDGDIYAKSLARRREGKPFVFYEGPPTANGLPHPGHCLTRTIKDIFPRYKTMDGRYCERKAGWDTHGLPVEIEVCKELGIMDGGKAAIEAYGVEKFNRACVESVFRYQKEWENLTDRIGFWVNLDEAYVTFHQSYVESVWWSLRQLFDRGLLYQGHKVVWWWAQGGTALSAGEVGEGYRDVDDPAITVRLPLTPESAERLGVPGETSLLVWTTTPWTLSSNCAACVGPDI